MKFNPHVRRKAEFVSDKQQRLETFKYAIRQKKEGIITGFGNIRRVTNGWTERISKWFLLPDWTLLKNNFFFWLVEAIIEGTTINFALHVIWDLTFTPFTALAYGIIVKKTIEYVEDVSIGVKKQPDGHTSNEVSAANQRYRKQ